MTRFGVVVLAVLVWITDATAAVIDESKVIDLTYSFDEHTIYWPTAKPFQLEVVSAQKTDAGYWYAANNVCFAEHAWLATRYSQGISASRLCSSSSRRRT